MMKSNCRQQTILKTLLQYHQKRNHSKIMNKTTIIILHFFKFVVIKLVQVFYVHSVFRNNFADHSQKCRRSRLFVRIKTLRRTFFFQNIKPNMFKTDGFMRFQQLGFIYMCIWLSTIFILSNVAVRILFLSFSSRDFRYAYRAIWRLPDIS